MELAFLGAGSAFCLTPGNFQSNMLLSSASGRRLLIDCGSDVRFSLAAAGLGPRDIHDVYISHLHADHVGGLEYLGFSSRFASPPFRIRLYTSETLLDELWNHSLSGGMRQAAADRCTLADFFEPWPVPARGRFDWEGISLELVPTRHVVGTNSSMISFGLFFEVAGTRVLLTTDTVFAPDDLALYLERADLIFHDCETGAPATGVHAHYDELVGLPKAVKAKTWLYHYNDGDKADAVADGFRGFVRAGQTFTF
jgi:ribonuclease BN (tRNA processing enzyme)